MARQCVLYFLDGPLAGQRVQVRGTTTDNDTYICQQRSSPRNIVNAKPTDRIPISTKILNYLYRMVDKKLCHMKLEKIY